MREFSFNWSLRAEKVLAMRTKVLSTYVNLDNEELRKTVEELCSAEEDYSDNELFGEVYANNYPDGHYGWRLVDVVRA